jgi:tRNA(Ile)-lysidine synthase
MMREQFEKVMAGFDLPSNCCLTVALSGGLDSVCLLHLLKQLPDKKFSLQAVHIEHGIRGEASRRDMEFCQTLCTEWGIPLQVFEGDAPTLAAERGMSLEEGARALRYGFLDRFADGEQRFCATAHHREDQAETFFINLYRGSGSGGLSGIKPRRQGYLRPLLGFEKEQLVAYAAANNLPFVTDATNEDLAYLRNFLRKEILPRLKGRAEGNFGEGLAASMQILASEHEALDQWAASVETKDAKALGQLPDAVLKRVLDRMNGKILPRIHFEQMAQLIRACPPSAQLQLQEGRYFRLEYGQVAFVAPQEAAQWVLIPDQPLEWQGWKFLLRSEEINSPFTHFQMDCDKINGNPILRRKQPGDRFIPAQGKGSSRLQKRLKNDRIPRSKREALWVLADDQGNLIWAEGYGAAKNFAPDCQTKRVYTLEIGHPKRD